MNSQSISNVRVLDAWLVLFFSESAVVFQGLADHIY